MRILIATGGTGGHIYPAILIGKEFRDLEFDVLFTVGRRETELKIVKREDVKYRVLPLLPPSSPFHYLSIILSLFSAIVIIKSYNPDKVIGTGSYTSFPILFWAKILKIPIYLHEQNTIPGKVTKIFSRYAKRVFISFPETKKYLDAETLFTGLPVREGGRDLNCSKILNKMGFDKNKPLFLAFGGSQGSITLLKMLKEVEDEIERLGLQGIVVKGNVGLDFDYKFNHVLINYIHDMPKFYKISDFVIARGGASTIWELINMKKPAIIIPIKRSSHQLKNAEFFRKIGGGYIVDEEDRESFIDSMHLMLKDRETLIRNLQSFNVPHWKKIIKEEILND